MKQRFRIKIARSDFDKLRNLVLQNLPSEAGAFALAGIATHSQTTDILVRRIIEIPQNLVRLQSAVRLELHPEAINGLISLCQSNELGAILCHSHPAQSPYSASDDYGERTIFETIRQFIPKEAPTASLLISPKGVQARVWLPGKNMPKPVSEVIIIGRSIERLNLAHSSEDAQDFKVQPLFDRQVRAFGSEGQSQLQQTKVGIVGVGGTGSSVAEQLARLGVEDIKIIERGKFEISNLTRMYGSFLGPPGQLWSFLRRWRNSQFKAYIIKQHLARIRPTVKVQAFPFNVALHKSAHALLDRDIIFLCTDEHWGRSIVNQITYQYLIPTINLGVAIASDNGEISGAVGIADVLRPDQPCLWCKQFLDSGRIAAESFPRSEREDLRQEGYVEDIDTPAPSVISTTTTVAGLGVTLFLQLVTDFMGPRGNISRQNYDILEGTVRRGTSTTDPTCICHTVRAFGDLKSLPVLNHIPNESN